MKTTCCIDGTGRVNIQSIEGSYYTWSDCEHAWEPELLDIEYQIHKLRIRQKSIEQKMIDAELMEQY